MEVPAGRRDFYKMGLVTGEMTIGYGGELLGLSGTVLFFVIPVSLELRNNALPTPPSPSPPATGKTGPADDKAPSHTAAGGNGRND